MSVRQLVFTLGLFGTLFLGGAAVAAQQGTITGRVVDSQTMQPLASAQVYVRGGAGTLSNAQGTFRLEVPAGRHSLVAELIGYQSVAVVASVDPGETVDVELALGQTALLLDPVSVTATRQQTERSLSAPSHVSVATVEEIEVRATTSPVDYVRTMPGVDAVQTGINQSNTVTRGFNNVFSGALLVLTDNRYARVPSLRLNAYNMIPATPLDVERVEVVLGPASALYGPNSASGVMHVITSSPIDRPGTSVSLTGGTRDLFAGALRQAFRFNERIGLKVSGQYFRASDWEFVDPAEEPVPGNPLIGARDFDAERWGGEARLDLRPWDAPEDGVTFTYGINQLVNSIELTGIGAGQARDWRYQFGQVQVSKSGFFWQAFLNASDAGDTYLLRTGQPIVDKSTMFATQAQYGLTLADRLDLVAGVDFSETTPKTEGTINGANEDSDDTREIGGYLSATFALTETVDLVGALRIDDHEHLEDPVWSPRAGLVVEPTPGQVLRATYNRAFSTPSTNNLFLDLPAGQIPLDPLPFSYTVRTLGVPSTGFTWEERCPGGVNDYCMYSPFAPGTQLPATGAALWDGVLVPAALADPTLQAVLASQGWTPAQAAAALSLPQPGELTSLLRRFNPEDLETNPFLPDPGASAVTAIVPTITTTYELGYQGLIDEKVKVALSGYRSEIKDFVGPLNVETPTVFLDGPSVGTYVATRLIAGGMDPAVASAIAGQVAPTAAMIPLGTVVPDQRSDSDLILTYRNFGDVELWGADVGVEAYVTDQLALTGSYSWVSKECFDFNDDGTCTSAVDIALNAPTSKGSVGVRFDDPGTGFTLGARARYSGDFPMNSGVYVGMVDSYTVFDANAAYRVPGYEGFIVSLTVNNIANDEHREFIGAPEIGRLALLKLQYEFGGGGQ
jgi:iron complex outermembrane receptor protein